MNRVLIVLVALTLCLALCESEDFESCPFDGTSSDDTTIEEPHCKNAGTLLRNGSCLCLPQFAGERCQRLRKSQAVTFLLGFFFTEFGAANFYLQNYVAGTIEFIVGFPFLLLVAYADIRALVTGVPYSTNMWRVKIVWFIALVPVWILGWRRALRSTYRDGFGDEMLYDLVWDPYQT